ncbi:hypothetical protein BDW66DRAFT_112292 [Aspergillus desertorum]
MRDELFFLRGLVVLVTRRSTYDSSREKANMRPYYRQGSSRGKFGYEAETARAEPSQTVRATGLDETRQKGKLLTRRTPAGLQLLEIQVGLFGEIFPRASAHDHRHLTYPITNLADCILHSQELRVARTESATMLLCDRRKLAGYQTSELNKPAAIALQS